MAKKRTQHAESRAIKKEENAKHHFFHSPVQVYIHPFWDRSLEYLLDRLLKIDPSSLPYNIEDDRSLVDRWSERLGFEELWVLNSIIKGVSRIHFHLSYDRDQILRTFHWKNFFEFEWEYATYAPHIWIDPKQVNMHIAWVGMDAWNHERFDFPDINLGIGEIIQNAITYWQSIVKTSGWGNPKEKKEFLTFLVILIQWMIFQPKGIVAPRKGGPVVYRHVIDDDAIARFRATFPEATHDLPSYEWDNPFQIRTSVNWSLAIVHLAKILEEGKDFKKVVLMTETRPAESLQITLRDFCATQWISFVSRYFPKETINLDLSELSVYLIEESLLWRLYKYTGFGSSPIVPLTGIKQSHQQRRH